ncbi:hypothetical protein OIU78_020996 [Salix suchowensis]|nr:hypothetical protein OIU78_020996 [Salix suchowensis]
MESRKPEATQVQLMGPGEKRQNETLLKPLAISFSVTTLFTRITPLYGSSLLYADPTESSLVVGFCTFLHQVIGELVIVMMLRLVELTAKSTSCAQTFRNGNRVDRDIKRTLPSSSIFPCYSVFSEIQILEPGACPRTQPDIYKSMRPKNRMFFVLRIGRPVGQKSKPLIIPDGKV